MTTINKYTPKAISDSTLKFSIPLYQRLFEWDKSQIQQLLNDLYGSFTKNANEPYYIGLLTVYKKSSDDELSLVDGQQRFTVLTLMAIAFESFSWKKFLKENTNNRLTFTSRKSDNEFLVSKIDNIETVHKNEKMCAAIKTITEYVEKLDVKQTELFTDFIFNKATFFISYLPENYNSQDLNRYFESMNSAGKGLENHEILKVNLLKILPDDKKDFHTKIWNSVSQMDKCIIRQRTWKNENVEQFRARFNNAIQNIDDQVRAYSYCNDSGNKIEDVGLKSIREAVAINIVPNKQISTQNDRAIISFDDFLLQVLYLQIENKDAIRGLDFFNSHKLQQTFSKFINADNVVLFMENLLKYRILFDNYIIRISQIDSGNLSYTLNFRDVSSSLALPQLIQYQSMLYVSTSSYLWLSPTLENLAINKPNDAKVFLNKLKEIDNKRHENIPVQMKFGHIDRYWFWRLDYYLWENRAIYFSGKQKEIADKYIFKANRSIEHISPQKPKSESNINLDENILHSFGNLAMISSSQNSSLQNESYEVKKAHVASFVKGSVGGSIESLKLLKAQEYDVWNNNIIIKHHNEMIDVLNNSFIDSEIFLNHKLKDEGADEN